MALEPPAEGQGRLYIPREHQKPSGNDTQSSDDEVAITHGHKERMPEAVDLLTEAFRNDPVIRYMLCNLTEEQRQAYMHDYFVVLMKGAGLNGGNFHEIGGWGSCAVWMPPGKRVDNPWTILRCGFFGVLFKLGFAGVKRMLIEFQPQADAAKKKAFKERGLKFRYWYLFFIGTQIDHRGKGYASKLMRHFQEIATKEGVPIWLESTTENSMKIYRKLGWEVQQEIILGKGVAAADGNLQEGGPGLPIWCMLWVPPTAKMANGEATKQ